MSALLTLKAVIVRFPTSSGQFRKRDKLGGFVFFRCFFVFLSERGKKGDPHERTAVYGEQDFQRFV